MDKVYHYKEFQRFLKAFGINPRDLWVLSGDNVEGHFPDEPDREPKFSVDRLAFLLWGDK